MQFNKWLSISSMYCDAKYSMHMIDTRWSTWAIPCGEKNKNGYTLWWVNERVAFISVTTSSLPSSSTTVEVFDYNADQVSDILYDVERRKKKRNNHILKSIPFSLSCGEEFDQFVLFLLAVANKYHVFYFSLQSHVKYSQPLPTQKLHMPKKKTKNYYVFL